MIVKALNQLFRVVADEASVNPAFAAKLEASLSAFAETHVRRSAAEARVGEFHPIVHFRKTGEETFVKDISRYSADELRLIIQRHNLDPTGALQRRASRKAIVSHIAQSVRKRVERDGRLFEY